MRRASFRLIGIYRTREIGRVITELQSADTDGYTDNDCSPFGDGAVNVGHFFGFIDLSIGAGNKDRNDLMLYKSKMH